MTKKSKKNLIIRLIVYPILIVVVFLLGRVLWIQYAKEHPEQKLKAHKVWMKIQGIEYCETPQEAIRLYANALIKGDREEALIYTKYSTDRREGRKKRLSRRTDQELKEEGEDILKGYLKEENNVSAKWVVVLNINGKELRPTMRIISTGYDGWKID